MYMYVSTVKGYCTYIHTYSYIHMYVSIECISYPEEFLGRKVGVKLDDILLAMLNDEVLQMTQHALTVVLDLLWHTVCHILWSGY